MGSGRSRPVEFENFHNRTITNEESGSEVNFNSTLFHRLEQEV